MSKSVDMVLIDGPYMGMLLNVPHPVPATVEYADEEYTTGEYNQVHIGFIDEESDPAAIVALSGLTPSWDLK